MISDDRWLVVGSWLRIVDPSRSGAPSELALRRLFAAVVYVVVLDLAWDDLPQTFGVSPTQARRAFQHWTDVRMWQAIQQQGSGPSSAHRWAQQIRVLATHRARISGDTSNEAATAVAAHGRGDIAKSEVEPVVSEGPARRPPGRAQPVVSSGSESGAADADPMDISVPQPVRIWHTAEEYRIARAAMNRHPSSGGDLPAT